MVSSVMDKIFGDAPATEAQNAAQESEALVARVNSTIARFQQALDARNAESKRNTKPKAKARSVRYANKEEDAEKAFNAVAESADIGLGIGAKPRDKERGPSKATDQPLRKQLLNSQTKDSKLSTTRPKPGNNDNDQEDDMVDTKISKKRKRGGFLDEILAERGARRK